MANVSESHGQPRWSLTTELRRAERVRAPFRTDEAPWEPGKPKLQLVLGAVLEITVLGGELFTLCLARCVTT